MKFLNANAMIGAHFAPREGRFFDADDLMKVLGANMAGLLGLERR